PYEVQKPQALVIPLDCAFCTPGIAAGCPEGGGPPPEECVVRPASAGVTTPEEVAAGEVIPAALGADLDHVAGELVAGFAEAVELTLVRDAAAVGGPQGIAVDVGDEPELDLLADRAVLPGLLADVAGGPDELGMGVAYLEPAQLPSSPFA